MSSIEAEATEPVVPVVPVEQDQLSGATSLDVNAKENEEVPGPIALEPNGSVHQAVTVRESGKDCHADDRNPAFKAVEASSKVTDDIMIKVMTLTGKTIEITIDRTLDVSELKEKVAAQSGIPPAQQRLVFSGRQLVDDKTLQEQEIKAQSVLHLILALRGGN